MLSTVGLGEESLEGALVANIYGIGIGTTIGAETMLKEVTACRGQPIAVYGLESFSL